LKGIKIEGGVATVDFDKTLMDKVGGSCRVGAIRSQIENTLKQFSTIKEVIVSVGGKTEGVLEP
jgi:spore germination protein GerM